MKQPRSRFALLTRLGATLATLSTIGLSATTGTALAQSTWPDRPVKLLVTVGAGGAADTLSRHLANGFAQVAGGQTLLVENRPGAGGTIAAAAVTREKPDGYTLFLAEVGPNAVSHTLAKLPYDPHTAFSPIIHVANLPAVILMRADLPYKNLAEFIDAAKKQPGKFNYASAGLGNWTHLYMAHFNSRAGIEQVNIVYKSGSEMLTALLRGDADTAVITVSTSLAQVRAGKIKPLAGIGALPMRQLPDVPAVAQTLPGFDVSVWHGIVGPAGMDPALVARINETFNKVLQVPAVKTGITEAQAANIIGGTPQQFDAFIKSELKRWPEVVKQAGITQK